MKSAGTKVSRPKGKTLTWHFKAPRVHDFMWGADPEYLHDILPMPNGPDLHFYYKNKPETPGELEKAPAQNSRCHGVLQ